MVVASWYWREGYLKAMADLIENELCKFADKDKVEIFFSAHGVPKSYVEEFGDPYKEEIEQCVSLIMDRLRDRDIQNRHTLAYQSRVGPVSHPMLLQKNCPCDSMSSLFMVEDGIFFQRLSL